jgi:hypothetical protein
MRQALLLLLAQAIHQISVTDAVALKARSAAVCDA